MDIDSEWTAYNFNSNFPLPFRVLFLTFSTIFCFATNLHFLYFIGIDTSTILDIRLEDYRLNSTFTSISTTNSSTNNNDNSFLTTNRILTPFVHPSKLFPPIYKLSILGLLWSFLGLILFNFLTENDKNKMFKFRIIPTFFILVVLISIFAPWNILYQKERYMFLRALKRIIFSGLYSSVPFCDIILADILTSSAKVLGDVWVSGCLLLSVTERFGVEQSSNVPSGCGRIWMVPVMTSFRQCLSEVVTSSTPTPDKSMLNALKYFTAFPVILFSALQTVTGDPYHEAIEGESTGWLGKDLIFSLWVLSVLINSLYSFWWDVTNDWGLSLLTPTGWSSSPSVSYAFIQPSTSSTTRTSRSLSRPSQRSSGSRTISSPALNLALSASDFQIAPGTSRPQTPESRSSISNKLPLTFSTSSSTLSSSSSSSSKAYSTSSSPNLNFPFLRPILLLPDPYIYYLFILLDLILRLTWSLKLSSHLHSLQEIESGIFLMESLEVLRRWMWVFLRIEWEAIRKGTGGGSSSGGMGGEGRERMEEEELEMGGIGDNFVGGNNYRKESESSNSSSSHGGNNSRNNSSSQKGNGNGSISHQYDLNGLNRSGSGNVKASLGEIGLGIIGE